MIIGVLTAELHLQGLTSLKQKRSIVKSLLSRMRNKFNVSAAEVYRQDNKQLAVIGISIVSNETRYINQQFEKIVNFMEKDGRFYLGTVERETF